MTDDLAPTELRLPPAYRLVRRDTVDSTNEEAKRLVREGAEDGTLVWALEQTKGRGRHGRTWASPPGNLYLSLVLRPDCAPAVAAQLGFVAALALGDAVGSVAPPMVEVRYKWPNDVLFNRHKGAGILLESSLSPEGTLDWLVLGLGANVQSHPEDGAFPATSLRFEGAPPSVTVEALLEAFARHFLTWVNRWLEDGFDPVRQAWLSHAQKLGETITVRLERESLEGKFHDLGRDGALLLDLPDGSRREIAVGDVYF
jgi:BirA family biotin operon repressor/biotin-[acetyl-CoA-carboxylase] ligase